VLLRKAELEKNAFSRELEIFVECFGGSGLRQFAESASTWSSDGNGVTSRVTRLSEFSPHGRLFTFGSVLKITEVGQIFWATYFHATSYVLIMTKIWLGDILGDFFTNSSGHPGDEIGQFFAC
jgi:hypothetical protein